MEAQRWGVSGHAIAVDLVGAVDFEVEVAAEGFAGFDAVEVGDLEAGNFDQLGVALFEVHESDGVGAAVAAGAVGVEDGLDFQFEVNLWQFGDARQVITATQPCSGKVE